MVNVNNYGVGSTNYTTNTNTQKSNQGQAPANNSANNTSRPDDKYSFESNNMAAGKVPTLNVWDKMSTYFKDVMKTPQNLTSYKAFEQAIKNNPEGYLQPGSNDMGKIKDVQKKLNYLGMNLTVNGQFGSATETAIIRFKNSVGINDGYMTKSGKMAVTPIVTPQVWSLLNAQVSNKMNPNANVRGGSYVTPVTNQEKDWARQLAGKIQQFGYKPSEQERQRYENIYQRQQTNAAGASPTQQKQVAAPSAQEMNWAKQFAAKVQSGYKPTAHEKNTYQDIFNRNKTTNNTGATQQANNVPTGPSQQELAWATALMNKVKAGYKPNANEEAKYQQIYQKTQGQSAGSTQNTSAPTGPSQQEMNWAKQLAAKVSQGYKPNANEEAKYQEIYQKSQGQNVQASAASNQPATQQEINWAQQLEARVSQGYNPSPQERAKYDQIYAKSQGTTAATSTQPTQGTVSQQELNWAQQLEARVNTQGYQPSQQEIATYEDIFKRSQTQGTQQNQQTPKANGQAATQQELDWALQLEAKTKQGYQPTQTELSIYNEIAQKVNSGGVPAQSTDNTQTTNRPAPRQQAVDNDSAPARTSNRVSNEPFSYNQSTINSFKAAFPEATFRGKSVPYLPDNVARQVATQYGFSSVSELQSAIGAGVDGKFGPETFFKLNQVKNNQGTQQSEVPTATATNTVAAPQNGVTQSELDWAVQLQDKFSQGYQANPQEQAKYTDIFERYQSSGNNIIPDNAVAASNAPAVNTPAATSGNAPSQEEVDWASNLQVKIGQGYQANPQETAKYTDIYNRYQSSGNQVAQSNYTPPAQSTNTYQYAANVPTVGIDVNNPNPDVQWALQMLDKVQQQGYVPNNDELLKYEQVMANNRSVIS